MNRVCHGFHLMHRTNGSITAFDCLESWDVVDRIEEETDLIDTMVMGSYCRRLTKTASEDLLPLENKTTFNDQLFTFHQLRQMNVSSEQLLKWYTPIDIIEQYELGHETGLFFNCSNDENFWFGTHCQYTLDSADDIADIIYQRHRRQAQSPDNLLSITNGTCYIVDDDQCNSVICLDWREICDGKYRY